MFATIYFPNFYLQAALRYEPELRNKPAALIEEQKRKPVIVELNAAAELAGVEKGMTPSQALARCLQVAIKVRLAAPEKSMQQSLLQSAFALSPFVEETGPGIATMQFTDPRNLSRKVEGVLGQLETCGISAQAGIAPSPDTSLLAAQIATPILEIGNPKEFLAPMAIETLAFG